MQSGRAQHELCFWLLDLRPSYKREQAQCWATNITPPGPQLVSTEAGSQVRSDARNLGRALAEAACDLLRNYTKHCSTENLKQTDKALLPCMDSHSYDVCWVTCSHTGLYRHEKDTAPLWNIHLGNDNRIFNLIQTSTFWNQYSTVC